MLAAIIGALSVAVADAGGTATAAWSDIAFDDDHGGSQTTASTITFSSGGPRTFSVTHDIAIGNLKVQLGSGAYSSALSSGATFSTTTGQTVTFKYTCFSESESATVTVTDDAAAATVDTFTCAFSYTGIVF